MDISIVAKSNKAVDNITTRNPHIIHVVPDFKSNIIDYVKKSLGIRPNSIYAIVSKMGTVKIAGKSFNSKTYVNQLKVLIKQRKINVLVKPDLPTKIPKGKFVIIDHSITSQAIGYVNELASPKQALQFLFKNLKQNMKETKAEVGTEINQSLLFPLNRYEGGLIEVLNYIRQVPKQELSIDYNAFDDICFASVAIDEKRTSVIPIMGYNLKGGIDVYNANLAKLTTALKNLEKDRLKAIGVEKIIVHDKKLKDISDKISEKAIKDTHKETKEKDGFYQPSVEVDQKKLTSILRTHKVKDLTVANNIKNAIDEYLTDHKTKSDLDLNDKEQLEQLILKAIHFSLYQTDEVREEFLHDPAALIKKLADVNSHSKELNIPISENQQMIDPQKIVDLKTINSVRHEYELDDNIHSSIEELFQSLESKKSAPVKVLGIKRDYKDDNINRYIEYTVKMKNLTGGDKAPYEVKMKIPSLVNNRYLKLNSSEYILLAQQYLSPLTKDKSNETRFLTHFQMTRLLVKNMKFNVSQTEDVINYIETKYPEIIKTLEKEKNIPTKVEFIDGTIIEPRSETPFQRYDKKLIRSKKSNKFVIKKKDEENELTTGKNEFLFEELLNQIKNVNGEDKLTTSKRSIPYIQANIMSRKMALVFYLIQQQGLVETMVKLGVDYETGNEPNEAKKGHKRITVNLDDDGFLFIYPENKSQELIFNGLLQLPKSVRLLKSELNDRHALDDFLKEKFNTRTIERLDQATEKMIDPTTANLLKFHEYPENYIDVLTGPLLDKLLNDDPDHPADLSTLRVRQAEVFSNIIYDQLSIAHNNYVEKMNTGNEDAKIRMDENYIINNLMGRHRNARNDGGSLLEFVAPFSPVDELIKTAKVVKTGIGGIPSKQAFRKEQRTIHPSYMGNIAAHSTGEYDAGGWNSHSMGVLITNKYGNYGGKKPDESTNNWDSLGIDEALVPFVNSVNSDRLIMARTHMGQKIPIENADQALVETGAEYIVPQISSSKFVHTAKYDGEVIEVKDRESATIKYKNGRTETIDIHPRFSTTKRNSVIMISMDNLKVGDKFKKNQMVAWSKMFDGERFVAGKNINIAIMNYDGLSFEDGYVISEDTSSKFVSETIKKLVVLVPPDTKVLKFNSELYGSTAKNDVLLEFQYVDDIDDYIETYGLMDSNPDVEEEEEVVLFTKGKNTLKTISPGGEIVDIKIKINNPKKTDPALVTEWKKIVKEIKRKHKDLTKNAQSQKEMLSDNMDMSILKTGVHKHKGNFFEGALVEFYVKVPKALQKGDKISNRFGAKGVVTHVMSKDESPKAEISGDIGIFLPAAGVLGRKNSAVIKELYIGKVVHFLQEKVKERAASGEAIEDLKDFIIEVYDIMDPTKDKRLIKNIKEKLKAPAAELRKALVAGEIKFNYMIPPFNGPTFADIKEAAGILSIPLDEKVFIPKINAWTKVPVPVGIAYMSQMEQYAEDYENTRSQAGYNQITGQPLKGAARQGGQSLGGLDLFALLSYNAGPILEELMVGRSDNVIVKRAMLNNLRMTGESDIVKDPRKGQTRQLMNNLMKGLGLDMQG
jgi:hypothetical protein